MSELFSQLGLNGKMLLAQGVNFFILLAVLTTFVYRPLLKVLAERRRKIEMGLEQAAEAKQRLQQVDELKLERLKEADLEALKIVGEAEKRAGERAQEITAHAEHKATGIITEALAQAGRRQAEELDKLSGQSVELIRSAIAKLVEAKPEEFDERLIKQAADFLKSKI